ncbi:MAG: adenine phosphoribosyltransferase [Verrucomicrobiae bacterium]|nr:adenine phosphoribosyltransferase [Verrucomicrobiae bacterium]
MNDSAVRILRTALRTVPDFPKPGIQFIDITPVLQDPGLFALAIDLFCERYEKLGLDAIVAVDARGFIFGGAIARQLGVGFVPIRKKGKLPYRTREQSYDLEYGSATIAVHEDALRPGQRAALVDDVLATGGTAAAAAQLIVSLGAELAEATFFVELGFLNGRAKLAGLPMASIIRID